LSVSANNKGGIVYLVGAGPGDPGLITVRGIECLQKAEVVVYDRLANHSLLAHARHAELIDVGKQPKHHRVPQEEITAILVAQAGQGKVVVRLKGGDPFVFGRGGEEAQALAEAGIPFEIVPGITSAIAAPAYAGIPVTHRGAACSVGIITGHRADLASEPDCDWARVANSTDTLVFLMGVHNLPQIVEQLIASGRSPDTPIALVERASRTSQKTAVGTLANIVEQAAFIRPPAAIIVGEVVRLRESLRWFDRPDRHPLLGLRVLNTRPLDQAADLSQRLMALGAESVELPTTQTIPVADFGPLDAAISRLARANNQEAAWNWLIFTSTNSVTFFFDRLLQLGYDVRALAGVKIAVLGRATAEALLKYGLRADLPLSRSTSNDLTAEMGNLTGQRILVPHSNIAQPDLVAELQNRQADVQTIVAYAIEPVQPHPVALSALLDGGIDVATFVSPSAVTGLAAMLDGHQVDLPSPLTVACIGPATAEAARALGMHVDVMAEDYTIDGLLKALVKWHVERNILPTGINEHFVQEIGR
jgi:uroporphyrinogen III methyltransferase/synthase